MDCLLTNIVQGITPTEFVLIEDTIECSGQLLLLAFVKKLIGSHGHIHLFCLDPNTPLLLDSFGLNHSITCHKMYEAPIGWNRSSNVNCTNNISYQTDLFDFLKNYDENISDFAVVIDSLSLLVVNNDLSKLCRTLQNLIVGFSSGRKQTRLIGLLHKDCHHDSTLTNIEYLASCVISLKKESDLMEYLASIVHKSVGGKITKETIKFAISNDTLNVVGETKQSTPSFSSRIVTQEVHQLASKLTFSVSLKKEEELSRAQLVLPYEKISQTGKAEGGQIMYVPDEADDFDEEDPDDDLNI